MRAGPALLAALLLVASLSGLPAGDAAHGAEANYTVQPMNHQPGAEGVSYKQYAVSNTHIEHIDYLVGRFSAGSFGGCGQTNSEVFGIDRDDDAPGTNYDEDLRPHVESAHTTEHRFVADLYEPDDTVGSTTYIDVGDQFVSHTTDCFANPDRRGWYQMYSKINGSTDGEFLSNEGYSHYFYICDCDSEAEARETLGPPPSEKGATPTPTGTPTPTRTSEPTPTPTPPAAGTPFPSSTTTPAATPTPSPPPSATATATATPHSTPTARGGDDSGVNATPTATPADWDAYYPDTPTVAEGPGFGAPVAVLALAIAVVLAVRRD